MTWMGSLCWRSARSLLSGSQSLGNPARSVCRLNVSVSTMPPKGSWAPSSPARPRNASSMWMAAM